MRHLFTCLATLVAASYASVSHAQSTSPSITPVYSVQSNGVISGISRFVICDRNDAGRLLCGSATPTGTLCDVVESGGTTASSTSVLTTYSGRAGICPTAGSYLSVLHRGTDDRMYARNFCSDASHTVYPWGGPWQMFDGGDGWAADAVVAISVWPQWNNPGYQADTLHFFHRGTDNAVYWANTPPSTYDWDYGTGWVSLGGVIRYFPAAAFEGHTTAGGAKVSMFAIGTDNAVWYRSYNGGGWAGWGSLGGNATSAPAAASYADNWMSVYVRGADNYLWARDRATTTWSSWHRVGPNFAMTSGPGVTADTRTGIETIVARGTDGAIWRMKRVNGGTGSDWYRLGAWPS
jgi:hypothetical protein